MITVESHKQIKEGRNKTQIRQRIKEIKPPYSKYFSSVSKHLCWSCGITYPYHAKYIRHNLNLIFGRFVVIFFFFEFWGVLYLFKTRQDHASSIVWIINVGSVGERKLLKAISLFFNGEKIKSLNNHGNIQLIYFKIFIERKRFWYIPTSHWTNALNEICYNLYSWP